LELKFRKVGHGRAALIPSNLSLAVLKQTRSTENYLKAIYRLSGYDYGGLPEGHDAYPVNTNTLAASLHTKPSSVTSMLLKLSERGLVDYQPYQGALLTPYGFKLASHVVRRHRLWEYFLAGSLGLGSGEIHELAEELEHVRSVLLTDKLSDFLGTPTTDPHGNPIPGSDGQTVGLHRVALESVSLVFAGIQNRELNLLRDVNALGLLFGQAFEVIHRGSAAGQSWELRLADGRTVHLEDNQATTLLVVAKTNMQTLPTLNGPKTHA
jgi:DtxR family Mn-dependent transcriptional regulator